MIILLLLVGLVHSVRCQNDPFQPTQIHLSYPDEATQMMVTWSTVNDTESSVCEYGEEGLSLSVEGNRTLFVDGGEEQRAQYIHRATMLNLVPGQTYYYRVGSALGWSQLFYFTALTSGPSWSPRLALFGDMGNLNAQALPYVEEATLRGQLDMVFHVGDFAYDLFTHNGETGNEFMRKIERVAAYVPYMTCNGNHEGAYGFSHYINRFTMPHNGNENMFYSFDLGPVHFISFSSEYYFSGDNQQIENQYNFLEQELQKANLAENRALRPWIIAFAHRPLYCSNIYRDCNNTYNQIRIGIPPDQEYGVEELFYEYGVDLYIAGHVHSYERTYPLFNKTVMNGSEGSDPYVDPLATVYINTGSGGCRELATPFFSNGPAWSAFSSIDYGYTLLRPYNHTHLHIQYISTIKDGEIIDSVWIEKSRLTNFP